jgi:hypothetical protein
MRSRGREGKYGRGKGDEELKGNILNECKRERDCETCEVEKRGRSKYDVTAFE